MKTYQPKIYLVIPTIRSLNFLKQWGNQFRNCHLIVVEDHAQQQITISNKNFKSVHHFTWKDIYTDFREDEWIISRINSGIRSYGFWKAYQMGADVLVTLDDDCYPTSTRFVNQHLDNLYFNAASSWFSTYPNPKWMYTRGFPYQIRNQKKIVISHGLWSGALDLDAKTETKLPKCLNEQSYPPIRQIVPRGYYYPMCGMNLTFRREITPIMFFPMMGYQPNGKPWGYDRFDDIWAGIFSKKIIDHLELSVINGSPFVEHRKKSLPRENLQKEASGLKINETLWRLVDQVKLTKSSPKDCYIELAKKVKFPKSNYFTKLRRAMIIWANLF